MPWGIAIPCLLVVAVILGLFAYRYGNLHSEEKELATAMKSKLVEKQATVETPAGPATINYAETPNEGSLVLMIHGQGMAWQDYARVIPVLARGHQLVIVDCFGHGKSSHDPGLYTLQIQGQALLDFMSQNFDRPYVVCGHSSGGVIAAWMASRDAQAGSNITECILEDPPLFRVTPEKLSEGKGTFAWHDGMAIMHDYLQQRDEADGQKDMPTYYAEHSYLFSMFGNLQPKIAKWTRAHRAKHPEARVVVPWVPHDWVRGMYFYNEFDPEFSEAFYTGTFFDAAVSSASTSAPDPASALAAANGGEQAAPASDPASATAVAFDEAEMLKSITCPVVYVKVQTVYGNQGVLHAANTDEDAELVKECVSNCDFYLVQGGHDVHYEQPQTFIKIVE